MPRTALQLFIEGKSWVYDASGLTGALAAGNQWQNELAWSGGVAYRFPL